MSLFFNTMFYDSVCYMDHTDSWSGS